MSHPPLGEWIEIVPSMPIWPGTWSHPPLGEWIEIL